MELKHIIDILQEFNDYRRSQGKFADEDKTVKDLQYSAKEIGDAIDEAIRELKKNSFCKNIDDACTELGITPINLEKQSIVLSNAEFNQLLDMQCTGK